MNPILTHLRRNPGGQSLPEIMAALSLTENAAYKRLRNLMEAGQVTRHGRLKYEVPIYTLTGAPLRRALVRVHRWRAESYAARVARTVVALEHVSRPAHELGLPREALARMVREGVVVRVGEGSGKRFRLPGRVWKAPMPEWA